MFVNKRLIAKIHIYPTDFRLNRKRRFSRYCRNLRIVHRKQKEEYVENAIPPCYKSTQSILQNEHGVTVSPETITFFQCRFVCLQNDVITTERSYHHKHSGKGHVKVRHQIGCHREIVRRKKKIIVQT